MQSAFDRMRLVGGAVAVVTSERVVHTTLGSCTLQPRRPVTKQTRFRVGSTTTSMTSAFVATYVDERRLRWDQPVIDAWPEFRAPTDELTKGLTVRQLLNMASGLGDPPGARTLTSALRRRRRSSGASRFCRSSPSRASSSKTTRSTPWVATCHYWRPGSSSATSARHTRKP